jgi:SAM-dependent methyltransferase
MDSKLNIGINAATRLAELEQKLARTEYVQHFLLRSSGAPVPVFGKQTQQKLDAILKNFALKPEGLSFIDLGCNKGFFPLYAAAKGAYRAVGIDPDPELVSLGNQIAELMSLPASFHATRFRLDLAEQFGVFDIAYVGSAYHYFWYEFRDHVRIFEALSQLTVNVLIFEGPVNLDDRAWRNAVLRLTGETEEVIRKDFNDHAILGAASKFFDVTYKGASGHANERYLYEMKPLTRSAPRPKLERLGLIPERLMAAKVGSSAESGRTQEGIYHIEIDGRTVVKKKLRLKRAWCVTALQQFEKYFGSHPAPCGLCAHYGSRHEGQDLILYQDHIERSANLVGHGGLKRKLLRQKILHAAFRMQADLLRAGLIHSDLFISNVLVKDGEVFLVDYEGLILVDSDEYRDHFVNFYTLNLLSFISQVLFRGRASRDDLLTLPGVAFYGPGLPSWQHQSILDCLNPENADVRILFSQVLVVPSMITSIAFYETLLTQLPPLLP